MSIKLFPSNHERTLFIAIISFCIGVFIGLLPQLDSKTIAGTVATLVAAFAGAYFAYKFNENREKQRKDDIDLASANKVIFTLVRLYNHIASFNNQFILPHKNSPNAYISIQPLFGNSDTNLVLDYDSISFLFAHRKPEILSEIAELENLFSTFIETEKARSHMNLNIVQPAMEKAGIANGTSITLGEIDKLLGDRTSVIMKSLTDELINITECGEKQSEQVIKKLHEVMVGIFPDKNVVKMQKLNKLIN